MFGVSKTEKQLKELRESIERIEHSFKKLEIEWAETYDKFRQLNWRVAKRVKQLETDAPPEEPVQAPPDGLSARQAEVNARILARRNRVNGGG